MSSPDSPIGVGLASLRKRCCRQTTRTSTRRVQQETKKLPGTIKTVATTMPMAIPFAQRPNPKPDDVAMEDVVVCVVPPPVLPTQLRCVMCFDDFEEKQGLCCGDDPGTSHFSCFSCLTSYIKQFSSDPGAIRRWSGCLPCPRRDMGHEACPHGHPWTAEHIWKVATSAAISLGASSFNPIVAFTDALSALVSLLDRLCKTSSSVIVTTTIAATNPISPTPSPQPSWDANSLDTFVRNQLESVRQMLTPSCSHCQCVFVDYTGCDLLTCRACGGLFCALCPEVFHTIPAGHAHLDTVHGERYGGMENFRKTHQVRVRLRVRDYLRTLPRTVAIGLLVDLYPELTALGIPCKAILDELTVSNTATACTTSASTK